MLKRSTFIAVAAMALAGAGPIQAQQLHSTGTGNWYVWCTPADAALAAAASGCVSDWQQAVRINADPGGWASDPTLDGAYYIGAVETGSVNGGVSGEDPNYTYTFRTHLGLTNYTGGVQVNLTTFFLDNYWVGWSFDGVDFFDSGISPDPADPNGRNWTTDFQLTAYDHVGSDWDGNFYLQITGNGRTDGILASGAVSVPEPGTYGLLLVGLAGLGLVGIRRRVVVI